MPNSKKLLQAAAGSAGGEGLGVEDVFTTNLYRGNSSTYQVTNNIDLSGEGGMVWIKTYQGSAEAHVLTDTEFGPTQSHRLAVSSSPSSLGFSSFNSDGFTLNSGSLVNNTGSRYSSLTFRKCPNFFDIVTYTGNGSTQTISHNLGSVPGMYIVRRTDTSTSSWMVYHRGTDGTPENKYGQLNLGNGFQGYPLWNNTAPTSTEFSVGNDSTVNASGASYVVYLFAHHDGDGDFGINADQDIIKCGGYTGNGSSSSNTEINLGWEPEYLLLKRASGTADWCWWDAYRGWWQNEGASDSGYFLRPNSTSLELNQLRISPYAEGFSFYDNDLRVNNSGDSYVYMAIRKGPMKPIDSTTPTDFFNVDTTDGTTKTYHNNRLDSDFRVQTAWRRQKTTQDTYLSSRHLGDSISLRTNVYNGSFSDGDAEFDYPAGWSAETTTNYHSPMFRSAPNFHDNISWYGDGTARSIPHNLGVAPELVWVKRTDGADQWLCRFSSFSGSEYYNLESSGQVRSSTSVWNNQVPDADNIYLGNTSLGNSSGQRYQAWLWASLDGICKIGTFTGNGGSQDIDCGFTGSARYVHIIGSTGVTINNWWWNSEAGINSGSDPSFYFNATAYISSNDYIDPLTGGFTINNVSNINNSGITYNYIAVA